MAHPVGKWLPLSLPRKFMGDLMHASRQIPIIPIQRTINVAEVVAARQAALPRPGWCAIFCKAFALIATRRPELRRSYISFPWPHLYEHPESVANIAIERPWNGEPAVMFGHVRGPENQSLGTIESHLRRYKDCAPERIAFFRRIMKISRMPTAIRRIVWWYIVQGSAARRAQYLGTFGMSVVTGDGASLLYLISPTTTTLTYGMLQPNGSIDVRINFDHRVMDGGTAARALHDLDNTLNGEILAELRSLRRAAAA